MPVSSPTGSTGTAAAEDEARSTAAASSRGRRAKSPAREVSKSSSGSNGNEASERWSAVAAAVANGTVAKSGWSKFATHATSLLALVAALLSSDFLAALLSLLPADGKLWAVGVFAAMLRVAFLMLRLLTTPSTFSSKRSAGAAVLRVVLTLTVNALAILPQPTFLTIVGGAMSSGDAGKVAALRLGRTLWRASASVDALTAVVALLFAYYAAKMLPKDVPAACALAAASASVVAFTAGAASSHIERALGAHAAAALLGASLVAVSLATLMTWHAGAPTTVAQWLALPRGWVRIRAGATVAVGMASGVLMAASWRALEAHAYLGTIYRMCGLDVGTALLALPSSLLITRHEATLLHHPYAFHGLPLAASVPSGWLLIAADLLMANAALPPAFGALGACVYGCVLYANSLSPLPGFYLTAAAWLLLHLATYLGSDAAPGKHDVSLFGSEAAVLQLVHAKGMKAGAATLTFFGDRDLDVSSVAGLLLLVTSSVQLLLLRPLSGYLLPFGAAHWYYHPFILWLVLPHVASECLAQLRKGFNAVWRGKALFACGVVGLPDRALQDAAKRVGSLADALAPTLVNQLLAPSAIPEAQAAAGQAQ